jgi:hypothetical protein
MIYPNDTLLNLTVSNKLRDDLKTTATWAKILAIFNFINAGLGLISSFSRGSILWSVITTTIAILLNIYLLNFGRKMQAALAAISQEDFNDGLHDLRMYFKVYGIVIIVTIVICVFALLIVGTTFLTKI